ncbi:MAG TPA: chromate efflux transporter [Actinomycetota bacterium]|nr:chromate efflux transporter [Actinomycetota bacterium]
MRGRPVTGRPAPGRRGRAGHLIPFGEAFRYWLRLGFVNFGGPAGQIALMHHDLVERKRWISENRFLHALNYCMLLPGPEAQQLAIYVGWLLNGTWGGIVAGVLFVAPAFVLMLALSWTYAVHGDVAWVAAVFYGLRAAVVALVLVAVVRVGARALRNPAMAAIAAGAFVAIFVVAVPFPLVVAGAAATGLVGGRVRPDLFRRAAVHEAPSGDAGPLIADDHDADASPRLRTAAVLVVGLVVWWAPLLAVVLVRGADDTLAREALFFSHAAMITFGGAYAVLAYIDQAAVHHFGWLEPGQMVTGLGLAESTPGPLIMVTQFVGFLAAYRFPGGLDPVVAGALGAVVTVWATFAPCFLWIFLGAPYIERLRGNRLLDAALGAVTAAVVGVILDLAVSFGVATLFGDVGVGRLLVFTLPWPEPASLDPFALALAAVAFAGLWRFRWNVLWVVGGSAVAGLAYRAL